MITFVCWLFTHAVASSNAFQNVRTWLPLPVAPEINARLAPRRPCRTFRTNNTNPSAGRRPEVCVALPWLLTLNLSSRKKFYVATTYETKNSSKLPNIYSYIFPGCINRQWVIVLKRYLWPTLGFLKVSKALKFYSVITVARCHQGTRRVTWAL